jgi:hypothetical protein
MGSDEKSPELALAEAVAERTASRVRAGLREELDARDEALRERLRQDWLLGLAQLRDDLTTRGCWTPLPARYVEGPTIRAVCSWSTTSRLCGGRWSRS